MYTRKFQGFGGDGHGFFLKTVTNYLVQRTHKNNFVVRPQCASIGANGFMQNLQKSEKSEESEEILNIIVKVNFSRTLLSGKQSSLKSPKTKFLFILKFDKGVQGCRVFQNQNHVVQRRLKNNVKISDAIVRQMGIGRVS